MANRRRILASCLLLSFLIAPAVAANLPRQAPEVTINLTSRRQIHLSEYKGKVVVLCFFLTTCPHCQKTMGFLTKAQTDYAARGLQVLGSSIQEGAALAVPGFIQAFNPTFPVGYGDLAAAIAFMQHPPMLVPHVPMVAFIDKQGMVRAQVEGDDPKLGDQQEQFLRTQIEALLNEGTAAKKGDTKKSVPKRPAPGAPGTKSSER